LMVDSLMPLELRELDIPEMRLQYLYQIHEDWEIGENFPSYVDYLREWRDCWAEGIDPWWLYGPGLDGIENWLEEKRQKFWMKQDEANKEAEA